MTRHFTPEPLRPEPLTTEAFAPFGTILAPDGRSRLPVNTYGDKLNLFREGFESDQPIEWFIGEFFRRDGTALFLERHMALTQTFIPLGGKPFVLLVVAPDAPTDADGMPAAEATRAFLVPGDVAVQLHRGTWHENPFPLAAEGQRLLVTSHAALTRGHQANPRADLADLPLDLERRFFAERKLTCQVALPA